MCSLRVVVDNLCSSLKLDIIMLIIAGFELVLCDSNIYVSCFLVLLCMIVGWYITPFWRHLPWNGHDILFLQLHSLVCSVSLFSLLRTVLL